ncbi:MAG: hypothetical protein ACREVB_13190, partial [Burkholderiales bacterium]
MSRSRLRALALLACSALCGAPLLGCGGSDDGDSEATKAIKETFGTSATAVKRGNVDVRLQLDPEGLLALGGPLALTFKGPFAAPAAGGDQPRFHLAFVGTLAGEMYRGAVISTGDKGFVKFQGTEYAVDDNMFNQFKAAFESAQRKNTGGDKGPSLSKLGIKPSKWMKDAKNEGEEEVGGAPTIHISSGIDVAAMLTDFNSFLGKAGSLGLGNIGQQVPSEIPAEARRQLEQAIKDVRFDLWTGKDDKIMRKFELTLAFEVPEDQREQASGLESGDLKLSLALNELNKPQTVEAPANARPIQELLGQLGGLGALF